MQYSPSFERWTLSEPSAIAPIFAQRGRRGIYVLEYADGSMYVGKATNVLGRYRSHFHGSKHHEAWEDVVAFRFAEVPEGMDLDEPERSEIRRLKDEGIRLRNRQFVPNSVSPSPLDSVVDVVEQRHWVQGDETACHSDSASKVLRQRIRPGKFKKWSAQKAVRRRLYDAIVDDLAIAVGCLLPAPLETDGQYWTLSDFPSTASGRFATLNTGKLEFLYFPRFTYREQFGVIDEWTEQDLDEFCGFLNIGYTDPGSNELKPDTMEHWPGALLRTHAVVNYGKGNFVENISFPVGSLGALLKESPDLGVEARSFALTEMRYSSSNLFRRWHSRDFTDDVYRRIKKSQDTISTINKTSKPK